MGYIVHSWLLEERCEFFISFFLKITIDDLCSVSCEEHPPSFHGSRSLKFEA